MKKLVLVLSSVAVLAACSSKPKPAEVVATPPPPPAPVISMAHASLKASTGKKPSGMVHFTQEDSKVKAEAMFQGLKSGPYTMQISDITDCKNVSVNKNQKQIGEVVANRKGVVKTNLDVADTSTQELTGKTLTLQTKAKKNAKIVACGVVETMN